jgi:DNA-binding GntR family transcriptional regulator
MQNIAQHSLHDELLDRLKGMIVGGDLSPGDKIPERQLCEQFGVSRTPLREALKVLAAEGLVQLAPNRGAVVATLDPAEVEECIPISAAIEGLAGELACKAITDEEIAEIKALNASMAERYAQGNRNGFITANRQFHEKIVAATRNPLLASIYDTVFFRIGWSTLLSQLPDASIARILAEHDEMMSALEDRDGKRLSGLMSSQMQRLFETHNGVES